MMQNIPCPMCERGIAPGEVVCPGCRFVIRSFCSGCDLLIENNLRTCPACGVANIKFDPSLVLEPLQQQHPPGAGAPLGTGMNISRVALDIEFERESKELAREIEELKLSLDRPPAGNPAPPQTIHESQGLDFLPIDDDARFFLQNMPTTSADIQEDIAEKDPQSIVASWDAKIHAHAISPGKSTVLIGKTAGGGHVEGIGGTLFFTEGTLLFFSFHQTLDGAPNVFTYIDADMANFKARSFEPLIQDNYLEFHPHGLAKNMFPAATAVRVHFSWSFEGEMGDFNNQSFRLKSLIDRQQAFGTKACPVFAGKFAAKTNMSVHDPDSLLNKILADVEIYFPQAHEIIRERYPAAFGK